MGLGKGKRIHKSCSEVRHVPSVGMIGMINVNHPDFIACHPNLWDGDFYHPDIIPILAAIIPTYFVVLETMIFYHPNGFLELG